MSGIWNGATEKATQTRRQIRRKAVWKVQTFRQRHTRIQDIYNVMIHCILAMTNISLTLRLDPRSMLDARL